MRHAMIMNTPSTGLLTQQLKYNYNLQVQGPTTCNYTTYKYSEHFRRAKFLGFILCFIHIYLMFNVLII